MSNIAANEYVRRHLVRLINSVKKNSKKVLSGDDPEAIHDLRVSVRKIRTILRVLRKLYEPFYVDIIRSDLKVFFEKTNVTRDIEVSLSIVSEIVKGGRNKNISLWLRRMKQTEDRLKSDLNDYLKTEPLKKVLKLLQSLLAFPLKIKENEDFEIFIIRRINRIRNRILSLIDMINNNPETDPATLHRLRILCKRLRYSIEFFRPLLPASFVLKMKLMKKLQTVLGNLNDLFILTNVINNDRELADDAKIHLIGIVEEKKQNCIIEAKALLTSVQTQI
ncbi:MAG: CHAD domain-containing protein [Deltaproteobacteria bacterium]|nr:CHAD domain-containing protein [Deltaproteobacteria bacterium]